MSQLLPFPGLPIRPVLYGPDEPNSLVLVPGVLRVGLMLDEATGSRRVTPDDLTAWGASLPSLLALALTRMEQDSATDHWVSVDAVPGLSLYQAPDGHNAARMLLLDRLVPVWPVAGLVVAVPANEQLFAVALDRLDDLEALNVLVVAAGLAHQATDRPITDQAFWTDGRRCLPIAVDHEGDEVVVTLPPEAHEAVARLAALGFAAVAGEA